MADYNYQDIVNTFKKLGLKQGDNVFCHSNIGFFGRPENITDKNALCKLFLDAFLEVIGENGTIIFPTFSYTFCKKQLFDVELTPGVCGMLSEYARKDSRSIRSCDANFSIVAIGKKAKFFTENPTELSFGENSFWDRFKKSNGVFCNLNFDSGSTYIHYVEHALQVPYRWDKPFEGIVKNADGSENKAVFYHFVYDLDKPEDRPDFTKFDSKAKELNISKVQNLGKGQVLLISATDTFNLIEEQLKRDDKFLRFGDKNV